MVEHVLAKDETGFRLSLPALKNEFDFVMVNVRKNGSNKPFLRVFCFYVELWTKVLVLWIKDMGL